MSRFAASSIAVLAAVLACAAEAGRAIADERSVVTAHPADGPDIDLRWVIEDRLVRLELEPNLVFLDEIVEVPREDEDALHPVEAEAAREALESHLRAHHRMSLDGVEVEPQSTSFVVLEPELSLLRIFPRYGLRALTRMRLVFEYPTATAPREVALRWDVFPPNRVLEDPLGNAPPMEINGRLLADGVETVMVLTREKPEHVWQASEIARAARFLTVPALEIDSRSARRLWSAAATALGALAAGIAVAQRRRRKGAAFVLAVLAVVAFGAAAFHWRASESESSAPEDAQLAAVFEPLHTNLYRAFGYTEESAIYDALARSLTGRELLERIYGEVYAGLVLAEEGGAVGAVDEVRHVETAIESRALAEQPPRFRLRARWEVDGIVRHFGHAHWRTNGYAARYGLVGTSDGWRIESSEILASERLASGTNDPSRADAVPLPDKARR